MKNLGVFAIGMCLGLIFGAAISGDVYHSTTYMFEKDKSEYEYEPDTEVHINEDE